MLKPQFLLTHKIPIEVERREAGEYVDGDWVEGSCTTFIAQVNIQPLKPYELMQFLSQKDQEAGGKFILPMFFVLRNRGQTVMTPMSLLGKMIVTRL